MCRRDGQVDHDLDLWVGQEFVHAAYARNAVLFGALLGGFADNVRAGNHVQAELEPLDEIVQVLRADPPAADHTYLGLFHRSSLCC